MTAAPAVGPGDLVNVHSQLHNLRGLFSVEAVEGPAVTIRHLDGSGGKATIDKTDIVVAWKAAWVRKEESK